MRISSKYLSSSTTFFSAIKSGYFYEKAEYKLHTQQQAQLSLACKAVWLIHRHRIIAKHNQGVWTTSKAWLCLIY